jgi:hypothetical protein
MRSTPVFVHDLRCVLWSKGVLPSWGGPFRGEVFGRDEQFFAFPCDFAPHPPNPLLPQREKGESGCRDA